MRALNTDADPTSPEVFLCHILDHEDLDMMGHPSRSTRDNE
jgi:FtsP/CotA-like multicopper oxidase with cupredoxin domain